MTEPLPTDAERIAALTERVDILTEALRSTLDWGIDTTRRPTPGGLDEPGHVVRGTDRTREILDRLDA